MHTENESSNAAVEVHHLCFAYDDNKVLNDLSFRIEQGDYVGLLGPNGSGKTTLLKIILGLIEADSGEVTIFGKEHSRRASAALVGYVPQHASRAINEFPATVEEVVRSGRVARRGLLGRFTPADAAAVEEALEKTRLTELRDRNIAELSGGQRQRVYIARALAGEPRLLILDEPTTGVDAGVQHEFFSFLRQLNQEDGITILLVSHDLDTITHETKTVMCLNQQLVCNLPTREFLDSEHLEALFGAGHHGTHTTQAHPHPHGKDKSHSH